MFFSFFSFFFSFFFFNWPQSFVLNWRHLNVLMEVLLNLKEKNVCDLVNVYVRYLHKRRCRLSRFDVIWRTLNEALNINVWFKPKFFIASLPFFLFWLVQIKRNNRNNADLHILIVTGISTAFVSKKKTSFSKNAYKKNLWNNKCGLKLFIFDMIYTQRASFLTSLEKKKCYNKLLKQCV